MKVYNEHNAPYKLNGINWTSPFPILGLLGGIFHFYSNFNKILCKQTVKTLIRRHILCLIWVCTVCICPTKRTLGLYGLIKSDKLEDKLTFKMREDISETQSKYLL